MAIFGSLAPDYAEPQADPSAMPQWTLDAIRQRLMPQLAGVPQSLHTTMPPEPVQDVMKSMVEPVTTAGWMLGGAMQGTERPSPVDVMKAAGGLALGVMPIGPGEAGAAARGAEAVAGRLAAQPSRTMRIPLKNIEHGEAAMPGGTLSDPETPGLIKKYAEMPTDFPPIEAIPPESKGGKWMVYDGSRRLEAAKLRGDTDIRVIDPSAPLPQLITEATGPVHPARIAQSLPLGKGAVDDPLNHISLEKMKAHPLSYEHNIGLLRDYDIMRPEDVAGKTTDEVATTFKEKIKDNLRWLYNMVPENIRQRSQLWYDGANAIAHGRAGQYNMPVQSTAGVYASLSPQKSWPENVAIGDRVLHIYHSNPEWTPGMSETFQRIFPAEQSERAQEKWNRLYNDLQGKKLSDIDDPAAKGLWIRLYDQTHHMPHFDIITPEGGVSHRAMLGDNVTPATLRWNGLNDIEKAVKAIESGGDPVKLSEAMGERHKVRNFYNNILDPNNPHGDVTMDTHAVAAALLKPLGGTSMEVGHNLALGTGEKSSDAYGIHGLYGIYADAYRELARELGVQPRQLQSITWEAGKGLFDAKTPTLKRAVNDIWQNYRQGVISADEARNQIHGAAGGIDTPEWHQP